MKVKQFFTKLRQLHEGVNVGKNKYSVKYFCQPTSFSFQISRIKKLESGNTLVNHLEPDFKSQVYNYWESKMLDIIKDIHKEVRILDRSIEQADDK